MEAYLNQPVKTLIENEEKVYKKVMRPNKMSIGIRMIEKIQKNLSKNMLLYTLIALVFGFIAGYYFQTEVYSELILPVVFIMIYPMMINMSLSHLKEIRGSAKPLLTALIVNFIYAPIIMYFLVKLFVPDTQIALALMFLSIAPASSMGLGYIGLAEGHILSGTVILTSAFLTSLVVYPIFGAYFANAVNISMPITLLLKNLLVIIVLPFILGIVTREYIERKHNAEKYQEVKPYFSTVTLLALYVLLFLIFASKAHLIIQKYIIILMLAPVAIIFYSLTTYLLVHINKKILKLEYGKHQAIVFTTVGKNVALTIAILIAVFGKDGQYMAMAPAIMSLFQAPFLMIYLKLSHHVRTYFNK
ncbi:MAG: arsenic resistance protein [Methanomicrobia archaeon]|nr:arsenic resistance protein [Methanomicrobia archaeon]